MMVKKIIGFVVFLYMLFVFLVVTIAANADELKIDKSIFCKELYTFSQYVLMRQENIMDAKMPSTSDSGEYTTYFYLAKVFDEYNQSALSLAEDAKCFDKKEERFASSD